MMRSSVLRGLLVLAVVVSPGVAAIATTAELYFSYDKNGQNRATNIQEGDSIFIVVYDPDENIDCDVRDKFTADVKIMDPKTGAYIVWDRRADFDPAAPSGDYLEETSADSGLFVSSRAFTVGAREDYDIEYKSTHVVGQEGSAPTDFKWGNYFFGDVEQEVEGLKVLHGIQGDVQRWVGSGSNSPVAYDVGPIGLADTEYAMPSDLEYGRTDQPSRWLVGRFENMDTLVGMVQDPNDETDVAIAMMKITDVEATISWNREIYKDANGAATITVVDADENLNCNKVEYVPVFIIVNPGAWNPAGTVQTPSAQTNDSPNNFCMLKRTGGVDGATGELHDYRPIRWWNIYNAEKNDFGDRGAKDGRYYMQYPKAGVDDISIHKQLFETVSANGITAVSFYAQETTSDSGVFELRLNSILVDLGFENLNVRDVLVAYYLDPNDEDDFKLATAYIEERNHSISSFTDAGRADQELYWIGRDPVYVQVIDSNANIDPCCPERMIVHICDPHEEDDGEFWVLDEVSSNSSVFFSHAGMSLLPTWDALGIGRPDLLGGYQLILDNWRLEVFNEDEVYVRYNDQEYMAGDNGYLGLADESTTTAYSGPRIDTIRSKNDVSFDVMSIGDTQVFDGQTTKMWFLDRNGNRVSGYVNSDCVFVEVQDPDQDEDQLRRERIAAFWDGGQNRPFGPLPLNEFGCNYERTQTHSVNALLGDTNIFNDSPDPDTNVDDGAAQLYVLNPRSGRWAGIDMLETGVASGIFVSVICIDLVDVYGCVPTLGVLPGDTIVAVYQDPSNHSDSAWISIKVGVGGGTPQGQSSTTEFVDAAGQPVDSYVAGEPVFVLVTDESHAQDVTLSGALLVDGVAYDLTTYGSQSHKFLSEAILLDLEPGDTVIATYIDPTDPTDTSTDTAMILAATLDVVRFYAAPSPFDSEVTFGYEGSGLASRMTVAVYDLAGDIVWSSEDENVSQIEWSGGSCNSLANGAYIYVVTATDGEHTFDGKGIVFASR